MSELFSNIDYSKFYNEIWEEEKLKQEIIGNNKEELDNNKKNKNLTEKLKEEIKKRNSKEK